MKDTSSKNGQEKNFSEEIAKLRALQSIEKQIPSPHMDEFRKMVREVKEQKKRNILLSNLFFICFAMLFILGICIAMLTAKVVFIILQCLAVAVVPFVVLYRKREKKYE